MATASGNQAILYRMVTTEHICPFGLKSLDLLKRRGYAVDDRQLTSRARTDAFMREHGVDTTPQTFIGDRRIGGYDALRAFFGMSQGGPEISYWPVAAVFGMALLMALAAGWAAFETIATVRTAEWFVAFSMCILALLKLQDLDGFSNRFLGYDLLAQRFVRYAYVYPFAEAFAGVLMVAGILTGVAAPVALFVGTVGAVSVTKAVYVDGRDLKCACVGGNSNVPLGFLSLTENLMMVAMAVWMLVK